MNFDVQTHMTSKTQMILKYQYNVPINIYKKYTYRHVYTGELVHSGGRGALPLGLVQYLLWRACVSVSSTVPDYSKPRM